MLRKICVGVAALCLAGSLAMGGEGLGLKVEVGLDIGVVENVTADIDGEVIEYGGLSIIPRVSVTKQFTEEWSASLGFRGVVGFDDDDGEVLEEDGEASFSQFEIGGLAGYTFKVNEQFSITPVLGLSWRSYSLEGDVDDADFGVEFDASFLALDFGAQMAFEVNDKVSISGGLMLGIPVAGSNEIDVESLLFTGDDDADLGGGFLFGISAAVEFKLNDTVALVGGLAYEMGTVDWEWDDIDEDGEDELSRFAIKLGATFKF